MFWQQSSADSASANNKTKSGKLTVKTVLAGVAIVVVLAAGLVFKAWPAHANPVSTQTHTQPAKSDMPSIFGAIPLDNIGAMVSFGQGGISVETGQMITSLLGTASLAGLFNANQQIAVDIVSAAVTVGKYPHAIFMLDIGARKLGPGSFNLNRLSMGVVVEAPAGEHGKLLALLKQTMDHYFNQDDSTLAWVGDGPIRRQKLFSKKYPKWNIWQWGSVGDRFIFTIGPKAYEQVYAAVTGKSPSMADNALVSLSATHDQDMTPRFILFYLNPDGLTQRLRPVMTVSYDNVLASFAAQDMNQFLYSAGYANRAYISKTYTQRGNRFEMSPLTVDFPPDDARAKVVPPQATMYGVGLADLSKAVHYGVDTYLASRNPVYREKLARNYNRLAGQADLGNVHQFLADRFSREALVVVHDWPKHPLNLPIAKTLLIRHDGRSDFKTEGDKILRTWGKMLRTMSAPAGQTQPASRSAWESLFDLQLDRSPDGVFFLHFGPVVLAAFGLDDHYLVISYSVPAVQANLQYLKTTFSPESRPASEPAGK